jgi:hypothetical protein
MITRNEWRSFFNSISKFSEERQVDLAVAGLDIGYQIEAEWLPFDGISYESNTDTIFVHTPRLDHAILRPTEVFAVMENNIVVSIEIKDEERTQILEFRPPIRLSEPKMTEIHPG